MLYPVELRGRENKIMLADLHGARLRPFDSLRSLRAGTGLDGRGGRRHMNFAKLGVGNGNRTRNRRSHSPVLCQLSYSHHRP